MNPNELQTEVIEQLLKSVRRSLRTIKVLLATFLVLLLLMLTGLGYVAYKVVTFTRDINSKVTNIENRTNNLLDIDELKKKLPGGIL